jgi:hypothetical protein
MATHEQTWVKVNAPVDVGVAQIVSALNSVEQIETLQSCQGERNGPWGYVYFSFGDWNTLCRLVFEKLAPRIREALADDATMEIQATTADRPMAKLSFRAEAAEAVASTLKEVLRYGRP